MPEEMVEATEMREAVDRALKLLTEREEKVLRMRFIWSDAGANLCKRRQKSQPVR